MDNNGSLKLLLLIFLGASLAYLFVSGIQKAMQNHRNNGGFGQRGGQKGKANAVVAANAATAAANAAPGSTAAVQAAQTGVNAIVSAANAPLAGQPGSSY